jgi:hypothetical protein
LVVPDHVNALTDFEDVRPNGLAHFVFCRVVYFLTSRKKAKLRPPLFLKCPLSGLLVRDSFFSPNPDLKGIVPVGIQRF